jgi:predicted RNase H-related nuclease YkuK (DUF458 family)
MEENKIRGKLLGKGRSKESSTHIHKDPITLKGTQQRRKTKRQIMETVTEATPTPWKNSDGKRFTEAHVFDWVSKTKNDPENEYQVIVGTDSHMSGRSFRFITVICVYRVGKGGNYYYLENYEPRENYLGNAPRGRKTKGNQKMRMFNEVERSVAMAEKLLETCGVIPVVHIDASPSHRQEFTSEFSEQLKGYVTACGYECELKPDSWVANAVADKHTK